MGVPKFFRWLIRRYPLIVHSASYITDVPPIDMFFIDTNSIIHNITHSNDPEKLIRTSIYLKNSKEEIYHDFFLYLDDLIHLIRPKKLLYIAIDSVPPFAKITQQRSRRFAATENMENLRQRNFRENIEIFDINAISPGTQFMDEFQKKIDFFLQIKVQQDPLYKSLKVIFSGLNSPGEGEHKILEYIRKYKLSNEYNPNNHICLYGPDADLIMLGLLTHEPNLVIVRENLEFSNNKKKKPIRGISRKRIDSPLQFDLLYINLLREYLSLEYSSLKTKQGEPFDIERIIDDFVFLCFFVGNDFLPYLNTVDIGEGSLDLIIKMYKKALQFNNDYLVENAEIKWKNAQIIFYELQKDEIRVFISRKMKVINSRNRRIQEKSNSGPEDEAQRKNKLMEKKEDHLKKLQSEGKLKELIDQLNTKEGLEKYTESNFTAINIPDSEISESDNNQGEVSEPAPMMPSNPTFLKNYEKDINFLEELCQIYQKDVSRARKYYYNEKLKIDIDTPEGENFIQNMILKYAEGLQWVFLYYYKGCQHWGWSYNYHYAPLVSDIVNIESLIKLKPIDFQAATNPRDLLTPFQQLLCILPQCSSNLMPLIYRSLFEDSSPIKHFYPDDFEVDYNERLLDWEAIKLIPFIDLTLLKKAEEQILKFSKCSIVAQSNPLYFREEEIRRNQFSFCTNRYEYNFHPSGEELVSQLDGFPNITRSCTLTKFEFDAEIIGQHKFSSFISRWYKKSIDLPSLHNYVQIVGCELNIVNEKRRTYERLEIILKNELNTLKAESLKDIIGKSIYINFPFFKEAKVVGIWDNNEYIYLNDFPDYELKPKFTVANCTNKELKQMDRKNMTWRKFGIKFSPDFCNLVIEYNSLGGINLEFVNNKEHASNQFYKYFIRNHEFELGCMVSFNRPNNHYLSIDNLISQKEVMYPILSPCLILRGKMGGSLGFITQYTHPDHVEIAFSKNKLLNLNKQICELMLTVSPIEESANIKLKQFCLDNKISIGALNRILGSCIIIHKSDSNEEIVFDIGLKMRDSKTYVHVPNLINYNFKSKDWLISSDLSYIILEYKKLFPRVFDILENKYGETATGNKNWKIYSSDLYKNEENPEAQLKEILKWIMNLSVTNFPFIPNNSQIISQDFLTKVRYLVGRFKERLSKKLVRLEMPQENVFVETHPYWWQPYNSKSLSNHMVGDIVILVKSLGMGHMQFGSWGIICAIFQENILVELSEPQMKGDSYYNTCQKYCGSIINAKSVFNISNEMRFKMTKQRKPNNNNTEGIEQKYAPNNDTLGQQLPFAGKKNRHHHHHNQEHDYFKPKKEIKKTILKRKDNKN